MTTTQSVRGLKRKVYQEFHDFCPGYEKEAAEYRKAVIRDINVNPKGKKGKEQEEQSWPRLKSTDELNYEKWVENVTNSKNQFNPHKDEDNRAIPNTGAFKTIRSITRIKRADGSEWLVTKSDLHGFDPVGDEVKLYLSQPEKWTRVIFKYRTEVNQYTKNFEKILEGPNGSEEMCDLPFSKENVKELYDQRESDQTIQFVVKDETTGNAVSVRDVTDNLLKTYEMFRDQDFDNLFRGNYIPDAIKEEMRKEAVARNWVGGTAGDYSGYNSNQPSGKGVYK